MVKLCIFLVNFNSSWHRGSCSVISLLVDLFKSCFLIKLWDMFL